MSHNRLIHLEPSARKLFKLTEDEDIRCNPMFRIHARSMVTMINSAVELLGPDLDLLQEDLFLLGSRHVGYGVQVEFLPIMGQAVDYAMEIQLKNDYTTNHKRAWQIIMNFMVQQMELGMIATIHKLTLDVTQSWRELKQIPNYKEIVGTLIYAKLFELVPKAKNLFMSLQDDDSCSVDSASVTSNTAQEKLQRHHAKAIVYMIGKAVNMLGPDLEPLSMSLIKLGKRHVAYGVEPHYLPFMRQALDYALSIVLGSKYTKRDQESWEIVVDFMVSKMTVGMLE
jgi:hemoglobin-like flavoprotein